MVVACLVSASVAHADPRPTTAFVGVGAVAGGDGAIGAANLGGALEVGVDIVGPLWLHAQAAGGLAISGFTGGSFAQVRGGVEGRKCGESSCATFGVDVGYQLEILGHSVACGEYPDCQGTRSAGVRAIPRMGVEFGHGLRWRPSIEVDFGQAGVGVLVTFACVYAW
jgi:hypothetical protein